MWDINLAMGCSFLQCFWSTNTHSHNAADFNIIAAFTKMFPCIVGLSRGDEVAGHESCHGMLFSAMLLVN